MIKISKPTYICLDASITKDNKLGIGLFNIITKEKIALSYCINTKNTLIAESMALVCAMEYAYKKGYEIVHFFTDNKALGDKEIDPRFLEKFPFKNAKISWIPRDLNKEADKMSKAGRNPNSGFWTEASNEPNKKVSSSNIKKMFDQYNYRQKVTFLRIMAKTEQELEFIKMLDKEVKGHYKFNYNEKTKYLIRMAKTIFTGKEVPLYVRKRLNKMKVLELDTIRFEKEFQRRKQIQNKI